MAKKTTKKKEIKKEKEEPKKNALNKVAGIVWCLIFIVLFGFALFKKGAFGIITGNILSLFFGKFYIVVGLSLLFSLGVLLFYHSDKPFYGNIKIGIIILNLAFMVLSALISYRGISDLELGLLKDIAAEIKNISLASANFGGGLIGSAIYIFFVSLFEKDGALICLIVMYVIALIFIIPLTYFAKAYRASKNVVKNTAESLEESHQKRKEQKEAEAKRLQEIEDAKKMSALNGEEIEIPEEFIDNIDEPKEIPNTSEFSKEYFLNADGVTEQTKEDNKQTSKPQAEYNVQASLQDASEPNLEEARVLRRVSSLEKYKVPTNITSMLTSARASSSDKNQNSAEIRGKKLIEILKSFGVEATLASYHIGPSVTKFEIIPGPSVRLNKFTSLSDNIKMGLAAKEIRIEAPIPGKSTVGIEVPNAENTMVRMSELITKVPSKKEDSKLLFALGKDLMGQPVFCELDKMPHLLIAGATGSGKSVCINTIITSLILRTHPLDVKLVLVDPKKVEFTPYHDIPHLMWPVITDAKMASMMLKKIVAIMEERYETFSKAAVREINSYNEKVEENNKNLKEGQEKMAKMPYIVVIIDELADLMAVANKEVEGSIQRITQLARASGIHLIVATQRPSTDVITGLIKSNLPSRISFAVSSSIDSRTILDRTGAEKLLGNGDMFYAPQGENDLIRVQGCFVSDSEIQNIAGYCKSQGKPEYDDTYFKLLNNESSGGSNATSGEEDDLYKEVVEFIAKTKKASTSSLQRRFGIGYNRAARLIDTLEENGLIGPANGSKPREVYVKEKEGE